jgi:hypothetical protein
MFPFFWIVSRNCLIPKTADIIIHLLTAPIVDRVTPIIRDTLMIVQYHHVQGLISAGLLKRVSRSTGSPFPCPAVACPVCGPYLTFVVNGEPIATHEEALQTARQWLRQVRFLHQRIGRYHPGMRPKTHRLLPNYADEKNAAINPLP